MVQTRSLAILFCLATAAHSCIPVKTPSPGMPATTPAPVVPACKKCPAGVLLTAGGPGDTTDASGACAVRTLTCPTPAATNHMLVQLLNVGVTLRGDGFDNVPDGKYTLKVTCNDAGTEWLEGVNIVRLVQSPVEIWRIIAVPMTRECILTVLLLFLNHAPITCKTIDVPTTVSNDGKMTQVNLNEEHSLELLQHWLDQAIGGLMGALATVKLEEVDDDDKEEHAQCAKNATSVIEHAKCTVQLLDKDKAVVTASKNSTKPSKTTSAKRSRSSTAIRATTATPLSQRVANKKNRQKYDEKTATKGKTRRREQRKNQHKDRRHVGSSGTRKKRSIDLSSFLVSLPKNENKNKNGRRNSTPATTTTRKPRKVVKASNYALRAANRQTPFGALARSIKNTVLEAKHKTVSKEWHTVIKEIREETKKLKARKALRKMFTSKMASIQDGYKNGTVNERRPLAMKDLEDFDDMDPRKMLDEAHRIEESLTGDEKILREPLKLMRQAVKLGLMAAGKNVSDFADKTIRLASPRFLPLTSEDEAAQDEQVDLISPSLFALHDEGRGVEKATSLVDGFGLAKTKEHMAWLDLVMEASGVTDAVEYLKDEKIKKALSGLMDGEGMKSPDGQPLYFTKKNVTEIYGEKETKKIDTFETLHNTYTPEQVEEQKKQGFSILTKEQLDIVYGKDSPYANPERLETLRKIPKEEMHGHIVNNIRALAEMESFKVRKKNLILAPVILFPAIFNPLVVSGPIILSPIILSPVIFSPAIFGSVILSPWVFVPVILSPRLLSPIIVNPMLFVPVILSPLALHPFILTPGVFVPFILSPLVLSPFILAPQVFTPAILSPFVLNPFIGTPTVGSPLILTPFALSPIIMSPQIMFAAILSPFVLSPLIQSPLIFAEVVLSPSALS